MVALYFYILPSIVIPTVPMRILRVTAPHTSLAIEHEPLAYHPSKPNDPVIACDLSL